MSSFDSERTAVVTGGAKGIGRACSDALRAAGFRVVVLGRDQHALRDAGYAHLVCDVTDEVSVAAAFDEIGVVDVLVNNAGVSLSAPVHRTSLADWNEAFAVNATGAFLCARAVLSGMRERNWGRIVFISRESGLHIGAEMFHYGMTKTAQIAIARGLAETCAGTGVTVNAVLPGPTASEGVKDFVESLAKENNQSRDEFEKEFFKTARPTSLLKRFAKPDEVAPIVAFICSPLSSATNGAALRVDGGVVKSPF